MSRGTSFSLQWDGVAPEQFARTFAEMLKVSRKEASQLVAEQAPRLADDLFKATPKASSKQIRQDVKAQGWRLKTGYDRRTLIGKVARSVKGINANAPGANYRMSLRDLQLFVIGQRAGRIGAARAGWIPAMQRLGSRMRVAKTGGRRKFLGDIKIQLQGSRPFIVITNRMPGIVTVDKKYQIVRTAIKMRWLDMRVYIDKKKAARAKQFK